MTGTLTFFRELMGYGLASVAALAADSGLLYLLTTYAGCSYLPAAATSFVAGAAVAYQLSVRLAFHDHRLRNRKAEFTSFVLLGIAGLLVNMLVLRIAVGTFGIQLLLAKGLSAGCTFLTNFILRRQFLFRPGARKSRAGNTQETRGVIPG